MNIENEINQLKFRNNYHKAFVNIIFTYHWIYQFQCQLLKKYKITPQQFNILRILRGSYPAPLTVKIIRDRMLDKMSDASRIVEKLRKKNLVLRKECKSDRRKVDILISKKGLELLLKLDKYDKTMDEVLSNLNENEVEKLNYLLDKIRNKRS